jgi:hypothetical protein
VVNAFLLDLALSCCGAHCDLRQLRFGILGPLQVVGDDGHEVALGGRMPRALLVVLLLRPNEVITSDRLVEEYGRASLRRATPKGFRCMCRVCVTHLPPAALARTMSG